MSNKKRPAGQPWEPMRRGARIEKPIPARLRQYLVEDERDFVGMWLNDRYVVAQFERPGGITELSIRRQDREWPRDWRHFQRIKNEICGPEREAVELYPAESRLVDGANQFHLWVLPEGQHFPFGFFPTGRSVVNGDDPRLAGVAGRQRPVEEMS